MRQDILINVIFGCEIELISALARSSPRAVAVHVKR